MSKVSIKIAVLGQLPTDFDQRELLKLKSSVFEVNSSIETYQLNEDSEGNDWEYTDDQLEKYLTNPFAEDFLIILVNVKLQRNWFVRRLTNNRVLFSFHEIADILRFNNVPLQNIVLRVLYGATLIYRRYSDRIPPGTEKKQIMRTTKRADVYST